MCRCAASPDAHFSALPAPPAAFRGLHGHTGLLCAQLNTSVPFLTHTLAFGSDFCLATAVSAESLLVFGGRVGGGGGAEGALTNELASYDLGAWRCAAAATR